MKKTNILKKMNKSIWSCKKDMTQYNYQLCK